MNSPISLEWLSKTSFGRLSLEKYLMRDFPEFYEYLTNNYTFTDNIREKVYCFYMGIEAQPTCPICGKPCKFHGYTYGYSKFCGSRCAGSCEDVRQKVVDSLVEKYGEDYTRKMAENIRQTILEKYGTDNIMKLDVIKEKVKDTCRKRYGVDNAMQSEACKEKSKKTCIEKYGSEYYLTSEKHKSVRKSALEKSQQTCVKKYGYPSATQNPEVKKKISDTVQLKYGVSWSCMRSAAHNSHNYKSSPNETFARLLENNNIDYTREFIINDYSYDFRVGAILIEINPSATHNINWNPYGGKLQDKSYHKRKTINAIEAGYRCIHIWDWDDVEKIIHILSPKERIYARNCQIKEVKYKDIKSFQEKNHLQGYCRGQKICLALIYNDEIVEVITFGKPRYNKKYQYELIRLCTDNRYIIVGGTEKLFNYFLKKYQPMSIISYCDMSKFTGHVYDKLGFVLEKDPQPCCHWYNYKTHIHITNSLLLSIGYDKLFGTEFGKGCSNEQLMLQSKYIQVYDCGQALYKYIKQ